MSSLYFTPHLGQPSVGTVLENQLALFCSPALLAEYGAACVTACQLSTAYCVMLTHLEFESLAFGQQDKYVRAHGHYQAQRWHENHSIELYELDGFYCELWLEQECVQLPQYRIFACDAPLTSYALAEIAEHY